MIYVQNVNGKEIDMTEFVGMQFDGLMTREEVLGVIETNKVCLGEDERNQVYTELAKLNNI